MSRINAKDEFLYITNNFIVIGSIISFGGYYNEEDVESFQLKPLYSKEDYENFLKFLDREYNSGYGGQELYGIIFCEDNVWMERGEYDGSEWWEIHQYPNLKQFFDESDVIRYERFKKLGNLNKKI